MDEMGEVTARDAAASYRWPWRLMRYLLADYLKNFALALCGLVLLIAIGNVFDELNRVLRFQPPGWVLARYFAFKVPLLVAQAMPLAVLIGTLFTLAGMLKSHELVAMRAGGMSQWSIAAPFLGVSLLVSLLMILWGETVVPYASQKRVEIKKRYILKQIVPTWQHIDRLAVWTSRGRLVYADSADSREGKLTNVVIVEFNGLIPEGRIDAAKAKPVAGAWVLEDAQSYRWTGDQPKLVRRNRMVYPLAEGMKDMLYEEKPKENQTMADLRKYIERLRKTGKDSAGEEVFYYLKWAYPFASFIVTLLGLGISFTLQTSPREGPARAFLVVVVAAMAYIGMEQLGQTLGVGGVLHPIVAMWSANVVFLLAGLILLWKGWRF